MSTLSVNNVTEVGGAPVVTAGVLDSGSLPAGSVLQVVSTAKTDTFSASVAAGGNTAITGLTISHAVENIANKVVLIAQVSQGRALGYAGAALTAGGTLLNTGDASGSRTRSSISGATANSNFLQSGSLVFEYTPGTTSSVTYGVNLVNLSTATETIYVNRSQNDLDDAINARTACSLILMEVAG